MPLTVPRVTEAVIATGAQSCSATWGREERWVSAAGQGEGWTGPKPATEEEQGERGDGAGRGR